LKQCQAISPPPQPSPIKEEGEKTCNFFSHNPGTRHQMIVRGALMSIRHPAHEGAMPFVPSQG
jgi:hypothetical protein